MADDDVGGGTLKLESSQMTCGTWTFKHCNVSCDCEDEGSNILVNVLHPCDQSRPQPGFTRMGSSYRSITAEGVMTRIARD